MKLELDRKILLDALRRVSFVGAPATRLDSDGEKLVATAAVPTAKASRSRALPRRTASPDPKRATSPAPSRTNPRRTSPSRRPSLQKAHSLPKPRVNTSAAIAAAAAITGAAEASPRPPKPNKPITPADLTVCRGLPHEEVYEPCKKRF